MKKYFYIFVSLLVFIGAAALVADRQPRTSGLAPSQGTAYREITAPAGFVNSDPFTLRELIGQKVILLDFMTYSCINCIRTFPYLNAWHAKYAPHGLAIVGIHTPEFAFEKKVENVATAMRKYGITFPVVLDNDYGTWQAYGNQFWPRKYLIDIHGNIVYDHIGEGNYAETEQKIIELLRERSYVLGSADIIPTTTTRVNTRVNFDLIESPETYFGSWRNEYLSNGTPHRTGQQAFRLPTTIDRNKLYLGGSWNISREYAQNTEADARIIYRFRAKALHMVAAADQPVRVRVLVDGIPAATLAGSDVVDGAVTVDEERLYEIINDPDGYTEHTIELIIEAPGLKVFAFTFG